MENIIKSCFQINVDSCFECGAKAENQHHVVPRVLGGTKTIPLCEVCHGKVHDKDFTTCKRLTKIALQAKKARGELIGTVPFGSSLSADGVTLIPNYKELEIISIVKQMRLSGKSFRNISKELEVMGYFNRKGGKFYATQIYRMLNQQK